MTVRFRQHRFIKSITFAAILACVYLGFRAITSPFLDVAPRKHKENLAVDTGVAERQLFKDTDTTKWFPNHSWVKDAREEYYDQGRFLYCNSSVLSEDGKSIRVKPLAIRWTQAGKDEAVPTTLVADSATLHLATPFEGMDTKSLHISGGVISGNVQINGPHGLKIVGRTFTLAEASMNLWSSEQIRFEFEGHRGMASRGVDIQLRSSDEDGGLMNVDDISRVQLMGPVACDFEMQGTKKGEDDVKLKIKAARGFTFDFTTRTGTFAGIESAPRAGQTNAAPLKANEQVLVVHESTSLASEKPFLNKLVCPELILSFRNAVSQTTGRPLPNKMQLERVRAWGRRVVFYSEEHQVVVDANDFSYSLDEQRIDIRNTTNDMSDTQKFVKVRNTDADITVPHIRVLRSADSGEVSRIECNGRGIITSRTNLPNQKKTSKPTSFGASWFESLVMQVSPNSLKRAITLTGQAVVSNTDQDMRLAGQKIVMNLANTASPTKGNVNSGQPQPEKLTSAAAVDFGNLKPDVLEATGDVTLTSPQGSGELREKLTIRFEEFVPGPVRTASNSKESPGDSENSEEANIGQVSFTADTLEATVMVSTAKKNQAAEFHNLWLKGDVEVTRETLTSEGSFTATGNQLSAARGLRNDHSIQLFGDPAKVVSKEQNIEGTRIDLNQLDRSVEAVGSGRIQFLTKTGFDGKPLPRPTPLDIYWSESMSYQERSVTFAGNIRVVMSDGVTQDLELLCAGLTVYLADGVTLGKSEDNAMFKAVPGAGASSKDSKNPIERIECHNRVTVRIEQFTDGAISGRHRAVFADLNVDIASGDFDAIGPGYIESVSHDKNGSLQGSAPVTARANSAAKTTETAFVYMKAEFIGDLTGNLHTQEATLSQNVAVLIAPARRVDEKVSLQSIPTEQLPERAGILQAEKLTISAVDGPKGSGLNFSVVARKNARLESRDLVASADIINYDHSKEQFIIRADGDGNARVSHRNGLNGRLQNTSGTVTGNRFQYLRRTRSLTGDNIGGVNLNK